MEKLMALQDKSRGLLLSMLSCSISCITVTFITSPRLMPLNRGVTRSMLSFTLFLKGTKQRHAPADGNKGLELLPVSELLLLECDVPLWTSILHQYLNSNIEIHVKYTNLPWNHKVNTDANMQSKCMEVSPKWGHKYWSRYIPWRRWRGPGVGRLSSAAWRVADVRMGTGGPELRTDELNCLDHVSCLLSWAAVVEMEAHRKRGDGFRNGWCHLTGAGLCKLVV